MKNSYRIITENPKTAFALRTETVQKLRKAYLPITNLEERAKALFEHLSERFTYDANAKGDYTAESIYQRGYGVCRHAAYLYVTAAHFCDIPAEYIAVRKDNKGIPCQHACAAVYTPRQILVDIAYRKFDIKHHTYYVSDFNGFIPPHEEEANEKYQRFHTRMLLYERNEQEKRIPSRKLWLSIGSLTTLSMYILTELII